LKRIASMLYSVIIPVYNRPDEVRELLQSLAVQSYKKFEVLIIEDGSGKKCEDVAEEFSGKMKIRYFYKENSGQGFSRNYGFERAEGDYFVVFDSDCIIPSHYFERVSQYLALYRVDCWGGPDRAHPSFTSVQKAINFSMTSFLTTGGIRGGKKRVGEFYPRSFNMGISREVFEKTGGYKITRMGEDLEFSIRIIQNGFITALIEDAYVYHKRRTDLKQFFWQLHFFGRARINLKRFYPDELKGVHFFPLLFFLGFWISVLLFFTSLSWSGIPLLLYFFYALCLFVSAWFREKSLNVAALAAVAGYIQLSAYAIGLLNEQWKEVKKNF
jgi:glycosyltransferase involved in cell wall biosynthesis